jgi:hypothetical protein
MSQVVKIFVSRVEAAEMLGLSVRTIDRLCVRGLLKKAGSGGRALIVAASIGAYAEQLIAGVGEQEREAPITREPTFEELFPIPEIDKSRRRKRHAADEATQADAEVAA